MAGNDREQQPQSQSAQQPAASQPAADQEATDAFLHPSVGRVNALAMGNPTAPIAELTTILRAHPEDYEACMRRIHHFWGNQAAAQCAILVPHVSPSVLGIGGSPGVPAAATAATPASGEEHEAPEIETDPVTGEQDGSTDVGGVTLHATRQGNRPTGVGVEVASTRANTHTSGQVSVSDEGHVTAQGEATRRVTPNVAIGGTGQVEAAPTGEVRAQGGGSVRLRLDDHTALRIAGGIDSQGVLNQEVALEILTNPARQVPISDDARRRLRVVLRATENLPVGGPDAAPGGSVSVGIGGTF